MWINRFISDLSGCSSEYTAIDISEIGCFNYCECNSSLLWVAMSVGCESRQSRYFSALHVGSFWNSDKKKVIFFLLIIRFTLEKIRNFANEKENINIENFQFQTALNASWSPSGGRVSNWILQSWELWQFHVSLDSNDWSLVPLAQSVSWD